MTSLGKFVPVLAVTFILSACGGGATSTSDVAGNLPDTATDLNSAPVISGNPTTTVDEGGTYQFTPVAYDAEGDTLSFSVQNLPAWAAFSTANGSVSGTPDFDAAGVYPSITISVSDGSQSAVLPAFSITVNDVSQGPVVVPPDPAPGDVAGAPVMISAVVNGSDVVLTWVQNNAIPEGGYDVFIDGVDTGTQYRTTSTSRAIGGLDLSVSHCFNVESRYTSVGEFYSSNQVCSTAQAQPNQAPVISGTPSSSATVDAGYSFTPSASDPDGDSLSFTASNLPSWLSFNSGNGAISGTPSVSDVGVYNNILIIVSDGEESVSLPAFAINVNDAVVDNQAPTITGTPATAVTEGELYSFTPSANDADGDDLTFSVSNLPAWASFDSATGVLQGTPDVGETGDYTNIAISVTDGTDTVSLAAFSITVNAGDVVTGSMALRWIAPTTRADGSALDISEIDGYCIYIGTTSSNLEMVADLSGSSTTTYTADNLEVGTYYVAVTTYDVDGMSSGYSNIIETTVVN